MPKTTLNVVPSNRIRLILIPSRVSISLNFILTISFDNEMLSFCFRRKFINTHSNRTQLSLGGDEWKRCRVRARSIFILKRRTSQTNETNKSMAHFAITVPNEFHVKLHFALTSIAFTCITCASRYQFVESRSLYSWVEPRSTHLGRFKVRAKWLQYAHQLKRAKLAWLSLGLQ